MDAKLLRNVKRKDQIARLIITIGGFAVIASVIAILFLIFEVTIPLFQSTETKEISHFTADSTEIPMAIGIDEYLENYFLIYKSGTIAFHNLKNGRLQRSTSPAKKSSIRAIDQNSKHRFTLLWDDNSVDITTISYKPVFNAKGIRTIVPEVNTLHHLQLDSGSVLVQSKSREYDDEGLVVATLFTDNTFQIRKIISTTSLFGEESFEESVFNIVLPLQETVTAFTLNETGTLLYVGTDNGTLLRYAIDGEEHADLIATTPVFRGGTEISSLGMVFGSVSLVIGGSDGSLTTWMEVAVDNGDKKIQRIHSLQSHNGPITKIIASQRNKSLLTVDSRGVIHWDHMTSERNLLTMTPTTPTHLVALTGRNNGILVLDKNNELTAYQVNCPHPEISLQTLFGKVWYESYKEPAYVWQSSSGSDDFEPKFSITPLLFGTLKGTFYAMLFAIPLAIMGAVYVSQFTCGFFKNTIKPTVEIMASIPSVVIGFLIALWLAPIMEHGIVSFFTACLLIPSFFLLFMMYWQHASDTSETIRHMRKGYEFLILVPIILLAAGISIYLGPYIEQILFNGDFKQWLYSSLGVTYDQRNSIIIAFGLGFTVIPIIFSIAEDSLSNVPSNLGAASLALGASRWQTVRRVILPSASPGIFAGIMIGFGRAVGETMIVLMATGNTPIMDWSFFNGMRTLSANIAVEIPEAPVGDILYRVLFLCAVILFILTFLLNTGAELIREHLRKKYMRY